jgi:hypothetical protein
MDGCFTCEVVDDLLVVLHLGLVEVELVLHQDGALGPL